MTRKSGTALIIIVFTMGGLSTEAAESPWQLAKKPAPAITATSASAVPTLTTAGIVAARYPYGKPQRLLVTQADGKELMLTIEPTTSSIWKGDQPATLNDVRDGDQVNVEYTEQEGQRWVKSLHVSQAFQPTAAPTPAAPEVAPSTSTPMMPSVESPTAPPSPPPSPSTDTVQGTEPTASPDESPSAPAESKKDEGLY